MSGIDRDGIERNVAAHCGGPDLMAVPRRAAGLIAPVEMYFRKPAQPLET